MLVGRAPMPETRDKHARMIWSRFRDITPMETHAWVPKRLAAIVDKMLALKPEERYQDYGTLRQDLQAFASGETDGDSEPSIAATAPVEPPRVMVIHRSSNVQEILRATLSKYGYQVALMTDVERALNIFKLKPADCVIVDLDSTGQAGVAAFEVMCETAQAARRQCRAVFLANSEQVPWTGALKDGQATTLRKPLTLKPVYRALRQFLPRPKRKRKK
jgi:CheY-like chemotaxis protein